MNQGTKAGILMALVGLFLMMFIFVAFVAVSPIFMFFPVIIVMIIIFFAIFFMRYIASGALEDRAQRTKQCTTCQKDMKHDASFCPHCGAEQIDGIECEYCGTKNPSENAICSNCNGLLK